MNGGISLGAVLVQLANKLFQIIQEPPHGSGAENHLAHSITEGLLIAPNVRRALRSMSHAWY
jgi:hypothetical protein